MVKNPKIRSWMLMPMPIKTEILHPHSWAMIGLHVHAKFHQAKCSCRSKREKLEIWGRAQREAARRSKYDWEGDNLGG